MVNKARIGDGTMQTRTITADRIRSTMAQFGIYYNAFIDNDLRIG
jgi:hypothetical protein